jgi:hypothetical protein
LGEDKSPNEACNSFHSALELYVVMLIFSMVSDHQVQPVHLLPSITSTSVTSKSIIVLLVFLRENTEYLLENNLTQIYREYNKKADQLSKQVLWIEEEAIYFAMSMEKQIQRFEILSINY